MTIHAIGKTSYIIIASEGELIENHLSCENITKADAERLYHLALPDSDNTSVHLEVYEGKKEIMLFVRFSGDEVRAIAFKDFEDMLSAVRLMPEMCESELFHDGERYILVLTPWDGDPVPESVYEFGERIDVAPMYIPWLREHYVRIVAGKAVETLTNVF